MTIDLRDVTVRVRARTLVGNVSLHVQDGEVVGLVGPNGSGKSTLLGTLYAKRRRDTGSVRVGGLDVDQVRPDELARRLAVVAQDAPTDFPLSVRSMVGLGRLPHRGGWGRERRGDTEAVELAMRRTGVEELAGRELTSLSGGERQRVLLARALAQEADHLVLDEPTNHLDVRAQLELLGLVRGLALTTLVVLHDLNLAATHCDRLYVLARGRVVAHGQPREVVTPGLAADVFGVRAVLAPASLAGGPQLLFPPLDAAPPGGRHRDSRRTTTRSADAGRHAAHCDARRLH